MSKPALLFPVLIAAMSAGTTSAFSQQSSPNHDPGVPTSMFGTFLGKGQLLVSPFFSYASDHNREYQPARLGYALNEDFRGRFRSIEEGLFVGYGVTDWLMVELEGSHLNARLIKSSGDSSSMPGALQQSGLADLEGQVRFRLLKEGMNRPGLYAFVELTPATQKGQRLIAEPNWDLKPGVGAIRDFSWGTVQLRVAAEWNREAHSPDLGEVTIEYLKRLTPSLRVNLALEGGETGSNDEWTVVVGGAYRLNRALSLKLDTMVGVMSKSTDLEAQAGLLLWLKR